jgi:alpha-L-glutamate ligase-like protein
MGVLEFFKNSNKLLGMNSRNLEYIRPYNKTRAKKLADDKLLSKRMLKKNGVGVSKLLARIRSLEELENFDWQTLPNSFALKPNRGFGGEGIVVVYGKKKNVIDTWIKADRSLITVEDLKNHIQNILDGSFSLSNTPDTAFFEERLQLLKLFKPYAYKGIPDIRVIVFNKIPVMAMLRLPTKESGGKANLHQGAIGVGIDLATGVTTTAIQNNKFIEKIPGTQHPLSGLRIPYWKNLLLLAAKTQELSGLGFLGADIAIDKEHGPVVLELNARPGLSIQIANLAGLKERLERVRGIKIKTIEKGVRVGMDLFGGEIEEELEEISGKKIIGTVEKVKLIGKEEQEINIEAKIDTGAQSSSIDIALARELGFEDLLEKFNQIDLSEFELKPDQEEAIKTQFMSKYGKNIPGLENVAVIFSSNGASIRPTIKITFIVDEIEATTNVNIADRGDLKYPMIIGKRNLGKFLIDVTK